MSRVDQPELTARVAEMLNRRAAVGMAVGVVRNGSLEYFYAHGLADIASKTPITPDTVFRVASITKTFTAIAVMQLVEQGRIDLDAPASEYLRAFRLVPAKASFRPATVRHLLTHTAGVSEVLHPSDLLRPLFGETVKPGRPVPPLSEYYRDGLRINAEPGTRFAYTDHGFAALGQIVSDMSGQPLDRYFSGHIFEPLGMTSTSLIRTESAQPRLATGYAVRSAAPSLSPITTWCRLLRHRCIPLRQTWRATSPPFLAAARTRTARCSARRRWPPCSSRITSLIRGCQESAWHSGSAARAGTG